MTSLKLCGGCSRHVHDETRCPFCGTRIGAVAILPFAISLLMIGACTDRASGGAGAGADDSGSTSMSLSGSTTTEAEGGKTTSPLEGSTTSMTTDGTEEDSSGSTGLPACEDGSTSDDSGGGFIYGAPVPTSPCDTFVEEACLDCPAGEKCTPYAEYTAWDGTLCVPVAPDPASVGEPCVAMESATSGLDNCDATSTCWGVDPDTLEGTCVAFCHGTEGDAWCEDSSTSCVVNSNAVVAVCLPACDPFAQDCGPGLGCYPERTFVCAADVSEAAGAYGDPCDFDETCDPGSYCALPGDVPGCETINCCTTFCDLSDAAAVCPGATAGQECVPWFPDGDAPDGLENLGSCVVP